MDYRLIHARYDRVTKRAYVELRRPDDDGGEILVSAIFSFRTSSHLSIRQIEQDIVRKARHEFRRATAVGLWGNRAFTISRTRRLIMRPEFEKPDAASPT
jgi:hypothetical protein